MASRSPSRLALWLLAVLAAAVVIGAVVIPGVIAGRLERILSSAFLGGRVSVRVQGPPWRVLAGSFSTLEVEAAGAEVNQLQLERLFLRLSDVRVPLRPLFRGGTLSVQSAGGGAGDITLTRENVAQYLSRSRGMQRPTVTMQQGVITIEGDVRVGELDLRARLVGRLVIASPRTVNLHVQELTVSGVQIPREVGALLVATVNPLINLEGLLFPARVSSVAVEGGQVTIVVRVDPQ